MEVMVVLVIVGILTGLATVGWKSFSRKIGVRGAINDLRNAVELARSDAITRRHNSGIVIDVGSLRYLRFVDSSGAGVSNGVYDSGELVLQPWTKLPSTLVFYGSPASSISPVPQPHKCSQNSSTASPTSQTGKYSIVFNTDGSSMATFDAKMGAQSFTDTFHLVVLKPTGWVMLEK